MIIHDNGTEREATETEIAYYEGWQKEAAAEAKSRKAAEAAKAAARQAVLDKLGLTADEAAALLG